jgi:hypothetical protein
MPHGHTTLDRRAAGTARSVAAALAASVRLLIAIVLMGTALLVVALVGQGVAGARELPTADPSGRQGLPARPPVVPATPAGATFQERWTAGHDLLASQRTAAPPAAWAESPAGEQDPAGPPGQSGHEDSKLPPPQLWHMQPRGALTVKDQPAEQKPEGDRFPPGAILAAGPAAGVVPVAAAADLRTRFEQELDRLEADLRKNIKLRNDLQYRLALDPPANAEERRQLHEQLIQAEERLEANDRARARLPNVPKQLTPMSRFVPRPPHKAEDLQRRFHANDVKLRESDPGATDELLQLNTEREELRQDIIDLQIENYFHTQQGSESSAPQAPQPPGPPPLRPDTPDAPVTPDTPGSRPLRLPQPGDLQHAQDGDGTLPTAQAPVPVAEDATSREVAPQPLMLAPEEQGLRLASPGMTADAIDDNMYAQAGGLSMIDSPFASTPAARLTGDAKAFALVLGTLRATRGALAPKTAHEGAADFGEGPPQQTGEPREEAPAGAAQAPVLRRGNETREIYSSDGILQKRFLLDGTVEHYQDDGKTLKYIVMPDGTVKHFDQPSASEEAPPPAPDQPPGPTQGQPPAGGRSGEALRARFQQELERLDGEARRLAGEAQRLRDLRNELRQRSDPAVLQEMQRLIEQNNELDEQFAAVRRANERLPQVPPPGLVPRPPQDVAAEFQDRAAELQKWGEDLQQRFDANDRKRHEQLPGAEEEFQQLGNEREGLRQAVIDLQIENYFRMQESERQAPQQGVPTPPPSPPSPDGRDSRLEPPQPPADGTQSRTYAQAQHVSEEEVPQVLQEDGHGSPEPSDMALQARDAALDQVPPSIAAAQAPTAVEGREDPDAPSGVMVQQSSTPDPAPAVELASVDGSGDNPADADTDGAILAADAASDPFSNDFSTVS